ncbi:Hypothetical predicted protein [Mytilus galloprovincialis]|uniref:Uncharacterized protein n=1 Tax=Mytilus galloprovincialis TaxID=29158 RepID=A0A8B6EKA3_MYTGA|nr:Hypothetical predicted protein [Mytilus galloprovincialis]
MDQIEDSKQVDNTEQNKNIQKPQEDRCYAKQPQLQTAQDKELQKDPSTSSESRKTDIDTNKLKSEKNNINSDQVIQKRKARKTKNNQKRKSTV